MISLSLKMLFENFKMHLKKVYRYHNLGPACFTSNMPYVINYIFILEYNDQLLIVDYILMLTQPLYVINNYNTHLYTHIFVYIVQYFISSLIYLCLCIAKNPKASF